MDESDVCKDLSSCNDSPESLLDICTQYVVENLQYYWKQKQRILTLRDEECLLPREVCEKILECLQNNKKNSNLHISIFRDKQRTKLKKVFLQDSLITDDGLHMLLHHDLSELYLMANCDCLSFKSFIEIIGHANKLVVFETNVGFLNERNKVEQKYICTKINAPVLRKLSLRSQFIAYPNDFLRCFPSVTHLDLSDCKFCEDFVAIGNLIHLQSLVLYNVKGVEQSEFKYNTLEWICTLKNLEHLDISHEEEHYGQFVNPNETLSKIISNLPKLSSLDISGTNLAGNGVADRHKPGAPKCDIMGLTGRVNNPLEFLGLYGVSHAAASRHDIPALRITGDSTPEQIMTAATVYIDRENIFIKVLNDLFHMCRSEKERKDKFNRIVLIVLEGMRRHNVKQVQILGSAILFYVVKGNHFGSKLKKQIVVTIIDAMKNNVSELTMMRNGCLTLLNFDIPNDVLFKYKELVLILLHCIATDRTAEGLVQRLAISLLNSMACQVDEIHKIVLGECGIVTRMIAIIADRLSRNICDEVLQVAWSTLWNVTDETPCNCKLFIDEAGLDLFTECLNTFPNKDELLRNMMGLLGNIAEVKSLRYVFMTENFLSVFSELLDSEKDGIEVSYNAAGVIAHIASDGLDCWTVIDPPFEAVVSRMSAAINRWDIKKERNIHYRSFGPILRLISPTFHPVCYHWAVWALANLTTVYPHKYCKLLISEQGISLLQDCLTWDMQAYSYSNNLTALAMLTINNCLNNKDNSLQGECTNNLY